MFEWFLILILLAIVIVLFIKYSRLRGEIEQRARSIFETWRREELEIIKEEYDRKVEERARVLYEKWKIEEEERIRQDAISRSAATIIGKVGEHLAPIIIFSNYGINPKDIRFIGTPIDFIAFKGLSDEKPEKIIFIEVKSGKTLALTDREKKVKELIDAGRVEWKLIHLPTEIEKIYKKWRHKVDEKTIVII